MEERRKRKLSSKESPNCICRGSGERMSNENSGIGNCPRCSQQCEGESGSEKMTAPPAPTPAQAFDIGLLAPRRPRELCPPSRQDAPRILQENQRANAEPHHPQEFLNLDTFNYSHLRTPPSTKSQRLYIRGNSPPVPYRGYDRFERVSDEIILKIFQFLPRHIMCTCALVNRRWARLVCDLSLWRRLDMSGRLVKKGVLKLVLERGVEILRLNQSEIKGDFESTVVGVPDPSRSPLSEDRLYRIQLLDLSMASVETCLLESMLKFCPFLTKISLENLEVSEQLLSNLGMNSPYLNTLNLSMSKGVTASGLCHILQNCQSLAELNVAWTGLSAPDVKSLIYALPSQLIGLNISGCRDKLQDGDVAVLCKRCTRLQDLDLSDATEITVRSIDNIVKYLRHLHMLSISRCYKITPNQIVNLSKLTSLERLNIFGIMRDYTLEIVERHLTRFKLNRYPFSAIARPTVSNNTNVRIWTKNPKAQCT